MSLLFSTISNVIRNFYSFGRDQLFRMSTITHGRLIGTTIDKKDRQSVVIPSDCSSLLTDMDAFIFDCDGVVWKGDVVIEGAARVLAKLREKGKLIFFVTNNSTKSRNGFLSKFENMGLVVFPEEILSSSFAAAAYFRLNPLPAGKKVYVVGEGGIGEELDLIGVPHLGGLADAGKVVSLGPGVKVDHDHNVGAVVVGYDRHINYYKIQYAQLCINQNKGCQFIATNLDALSHMTDAQEWAAGGTMVGAIRGCTGKEPVVVGKPSALLVDYIIENYKVKRNKVCMVGDRLDTDILFGSTNGLKTVLVLSGVTSPTMVHNPNNDIIPDYCISSINDLVP